MGTSGSALGSRQRGGGGGGAILGLGGTLTASGDELGGDKGRDVVALPRDALRWPHWTLCVRERVCLSPPKPTRADTPPFHPHPIPVPWPPASRLLRWQSGHIWKPHLAQLQWELKKPRWQQSQSWGAPSPRLQAVTPAGRHSPQPPQCSQCHPTPQSPRTHPRAHRGLWAMRPGPCGQPGRRGPPGPPAGTWPGRGCCPRSCCLARGRLAASPPPPPPACRCHPR